MTIRKAAAKTGFFNPKQALGLPPGSVRALLAFLIVAPITVISLKSGVTLTGDQVIGFATAVVAFYFLDKRNA